MCVPSAFCLSASVPVYCMSWLDIMRCKHLHHILHWWLTVKITPLNTVDFAHVHVTKLVVSRLIMIPAARINSMTARATPLCRSRVLWGSCSSTAGASSVSISSITSVWPCEFPGSSGWESGHTYANVTVKSSQWNIVTFEFKGSNRHFYWKWVMNILFWFIVGRMH